MRRLIVCADDFGFDVSVNEAVEQAHRHGILSSASLMVTAPAAADAAARASRLPELRVGLHLVLIDGVPTLRGERGSLARRDGRFDASPLRAGLRYFFGPGIRARLAGEIRAQFDAFAATGLALDHVNAHKHMQLHPTIARLAVEIGREYGLRAMRLPAEPAAPLRCAVPRERRLPALFAPAVAALRRRLRRTGIVSNDHVFGIAWSGAMTKDRVMNLLPHLPEGVSEIYFHPAVGRSTAVAEAMPGYRNSEELDALLSPAVRQRIDQLGIALTTYGDLAEGR